MPDIDSAVTRDALSVGIRERARAVIAIAVQSRTDTVQPVPGALELLTHDAADTTALGARFGLGPAEEAILTLALAPDLAPDLGPAIAYLAGDATQQRPSLVLALALLDQALALDLGLLDELRVRGLLEARPRAWEPISAAPLVPAAGLVGYLLGAPALPSGVTPGDEVAPTPARPQRLPLDDVLSGAPTVVHLHGPDRAMLREIAVGIAADLGHGTLFVEGAPDEPALLAGLHREAVLRRALIVLEDLDGLRPAASLPHPILHLGTTAEPPRMPPGALVAPVRITAPDAAARSALWREALPPQLAAEAESLGDRFRLSPAEIRAAVRHARGLAGPAGLSASDGALLAAGARAQTGADLSRLAPRVQVLPRWDQLVLPADARAQLKELIGRVELRQRIVGDWGFGERRTAHPTTALFVGPTGTGKSMAAEAVAGRLGLALHRIDLSRVVSKYIGETEQQLDAIFEAAGRTTAILFFDEADALFGKRSEVHDAHDRYANLEVSYLLQRMESYDGVALLATNLAANIDEAFARRLDFTIHFPFPAPGARRELWRAAWTRQTPLGDLDAMLDQLAEQFELSGGNIRNIGLASAYLAAADGGVVDGRHVRHALHRELQKLGASAGEPEHEQAWP